jgi:Kdo2-lipid IVA lauroyltransferase/acyltransferase
VARPRRPPAALLWPWHWPVWLGVGLFRLNVLLPYRLQLSLGRALGRLLYRLLPRRRQIAAVNLGLCFPELTPGQRQELLREHFASLGCAAFEIPMSWWAGDRRLAPLCHLQGLEHLQAAAAQGRGVILLSGHFTALEIGARLLLPQARFHAMYRPQKNPVIEWVMAGSRERHCEKAISRHAAKEMIRSLRGGHTVWYAPDQNTQRKEGVFVEFFGVPAATNSGTARLAKMTGAPVVPFLVGRRADGSGYDLIVEPPLEGFPQGDLKADTRRINQVLESHIRRYPAQYLWIHRRFRTRPDRADPSPYGVLGLKNKAR